MNLYIAKRTLSGFILLACLAQRAWAQAPANTFEDLQKNLKLTAKETIEITDTQGQRYKAKVAALTPNSISIMQNRALVELSEMDVLRIRRTVPDGVGNGIGFGLLAGVGAGLVGVAATCPRNDSECTAYASAVLIPTFSGIGIGVGVLVDALIHKRETVFERSANTAKRGLFVAPLVGRNKTAGVSVSYRF